MDDWGGGSMHSFLSDRDICVGGFSNTLSVRRLVSSTSCLAGTAELLIGEHVIPHVFGIVRAALAIGFSFLPAFGSSSERRTSYWRG